MRLLEEIEKRKNAVAKLRDEIRDLVSDVESIIESLEHADGELSSGLRSLRSGVDSASQYL
jgi:ElaB/YqjD/DUF883 family membrane-anchored ribosome-binding protein